MNKKELLFIINPISGGKSKKDVESLIEANLDRNKFDYLIRYTEFANHAQEIIAEEIKGGQIIIAVGGDGTINEIAKALSTRKNTLGIIPMGSGNGLARHLGIPLNPKAAILALNTSKETSIDTAALNGHFFISIAGLGFDSLIAAEFEKANGRGLINYVRLSMIHYFKYKEEEYEIIIDGKKHIRKAALVTFANSNQFGNNAVISPKADLADGLLDVCILRKPNLWQAPKILFQVFNGRADQSRLLEIIRGKEIIITPNTNTFANVDGESIKVGERVEIKLESKNLKILVPQE